MKAHFISRMKDFVFLPLTDENDEWDGEHYILLSHLVVRLENGKLLIVPAGFVTNFGSIKGVLKCFLNPMGRSLRAFVVHDWLYSIIHGLDIPQRECDEILYDLGIQAGESWKAAQAINKGLALGGWTCYKKSKPKQSMVSISVVQKIIRDNHFHLLEGA